MFRILIIISFFVLYPPCAFPKGQPEQKVSGSKSGYLLESSYNKLAAETENLRSLTIKYKIDLSTKDLFCALSSINDMDSAGQLMISTISITSIETALAPMSQEAILMFAGNLQTNINALSSINKRLALYSLDAVNPRIKNSILTGYFEIKTSLVFINKLLETADTAAKNNPDEDVGPDPTTDKDISVEQNFAKGYALNLDNSTDYPIKAKTNQDCISFLVVLKVFHSSLSERNLITDDFHATSSLLLLESNANEILNIFNRILNLIALERIHGQSHQYNKTSINMLKMQIPSHEFLLDQCISSIQEISPRASGVEEAKKDLLELSEKGKELFRQISIDLNDVT